MSQSDPENKVIYLERRLACDHLGNRIARNIRLARLEQELDIEDLAELAGIPAVRIDRIERKLQIPDVVELMDLSIALKIPYQQLYGGPNTV